MDIVDVSKISRTFIRGLFRKVYPGTSVTFDYNEWRHYIGGLDELRSKTNVYKPEWIDAVSKLRTDLGYVDKEHGHLKFSGKVKVFPNDVTEFAFTRSWFSSLCPYLWLRPSEVHSLKLPPDSIVKAGQEAVRTAPSGVPWWKKDVEV